PHGGQLAVGARFSVIGPNHIEDLILGLALGVDPALDDLDAVNVGTVGFLDCPDGEARCSLARSLQSSAHGHTLRVSTFDKALCVRGGIDFAQLAEESDLDARTDGGKRFAILQSIPNSLAGILGRPYAGQRAWI